jgi:hypothetical protein
MAGPGAAGSGGGAAVGTEVDHLCLVRPSLPRSPLLSPSGPRGESGIATKARRTTLHVRPHARHSATPPVDGSVSSGALFVGVHPDSGGVAVVTAPCGTVVWGRLQTLLRCPDSSANRVRSPLLGYLYAYMRVPPAHVVVSSRRGVNGRAIAVLTAIGPDPLCPLSGRSTGQPNFRIEWLEGSGIFACWTGSTRREAE